MTNHRELSPFDCVLFYVIRLVVVMYLCILFVYLLGYCYIIFQIKESNPKLDLFSYLSPATCVFHTALSL